MTNLSSGSSPSLVGQVALVTGAAGSLGSMAARTFASAGAHVVLLDRAAGRLEDVAHAIRRDTGAEVMTHALDVTDPVAVAAAVEAAAQTFGRVGILLNNAGVGNSILWPWHTLFLTKAEDKIIYHLDADMYTASNVFAINKTFYEGLDANQKKAIDAHCTAEWAGKLEAAWADWEREGRTKIKALPNHKVHKMTAAERAQWVRATAPLGEKLYEGLKRYKLEGATLMTELRKELAK